MHYKLVEKEFIDLIERGIVNTDAAQSFFEIEECDLIKYAELYGEKKRFVVVEVLKTFNQTHDGFTPFVFQIKDKGFL